MSVALFLQSINMLMQKVVAFIFPPFLLKLISLCLFIPCFLWAKLSIKPYSKLHLGCGTNVLKGGWANIDLAWNINVIQWDCTEKLPVSSGVIKFIFNEHFIEHITREQGRAFLLECYRVLQPGGILRISTPNLRKCIDEYLLGYNSAWRNIKFSKNTGDLYTPCCMMNEVMRLWGHKFVYDHDELEKLVKDIGFSTITVVGWHESKYVELQNLECRPCNDEIILEIMK